jgi:hypothetical protein
MGAILDFFNRLHLKSPTLQMPGAGLRIMSKILATLGIRHVILLQASTEVSHRCLGSSMLCQDLWLNISPILT